MRDPTESLVIGLPDEPVETHHHDIDDHRTSVRIRVFNLIAVVTPFVGLVAAIILLWGVAFDWVHLLILAGMYLITGFGITIGYHRYFTHKSFKTSKPVAFILAGMGSMAIEGSVLQWVATHRRHHQHSDHDGDPHSPHTHGDTLIGSLRGLFHSHMGWFIGSRNRKQNQSAAGLFEGDMERYAKDLIDDPVAIKAHKWFPMWIALSFLIPGALGGLITMSWTGFFLGLLWGGLVRIFLIHHVTWSINSVCHIWGSKEFNSHDESKNNAIFGILALGEGWHNNHHAFPASARHGLRWYQLDISYIVIKALEKLGLVYDVRVPNPARIASKRAA